MVIPDCLGNMATFSALVRFGFVYIGYHNRISGWDAEGQVFGMNLTDRTCSNNPYIQALVFHKASFTQEILMID